MATRHRIAGAALAALAACGSSHRSPEFGLATRPVLSALPLPTGLPQPVPVQLEDAFPQLSFFRPIALVAPPDGSNRLAVVEQSGAIRIFANNPATAATTTLLDLSGTIQFGDEEGLLGFVFHPDFASNGRFYVYYSLLGPRRSVLSHFTISAGDPNQADPGSEQILLEIEQPFPNHNAGCLQFGPDGKLYVALGDGGSGDDPLNHGQDLTTLLGSVLRLNDDGTVPGDNPFVGGIAGERPEIWAYGLRNPWRMSFDRLTGDLWLGDVGQNAIEEIDRIERGGNYGWRVYEGLRSNVNPQGLPASAFVAPVHTYPHSDGASVTGGYVYRGSAVPALQGAYVYADFSSGRVWALVNDGNQTVQNVQIAQTVNPASFGEDAAGELYVCCFDDRIRKFVPDASNPPVTELPTTLSATGLFTDLATLQPTTGLIEYAVNAELWSDGAEKRRWIGVPGSAQLGFASDSAWTFPVGTVLVKHFELPGSAGARRLETRVLLQQRSGWTGFTYRWNDAGTDAELVPDGGASAAFVHDGVARTWDFPARGQCSQCHAPSFGTVLGVRTGQLQREFAFPLRADNQLRVWNHIGLFTTDLGDTTTLPAWADPNDSTALLADRARAYLAANCANCHHPQGPTPVDLDLRQHVPTAAMQLFGVAANNPLPGGSGLRAVAGDPVQSDLWQRMQRRDAAGMPPLGSHVVDTAGVALIGAWIAASTN